MYNPVTQIHIFTMHPSPIYSADSLLQKTSTPLSFPPTVVGCSAVRRVGAGCGPTPPASPSVMSARVSPIPWPCPKHPPPSHRTAGPRSSSKGTTCLNQRPTQCKTLLSFARIWAWLSVTSQMPAS